MVQRLELGTEAVYGFSMIIRESSINITSEFNAPDARPSLVLGRVASIGGPEAAVTIIPATGENPPANSYEVSCNDTTDGSCARGNMTACEAIGRCRGRGGFLLDQSGSAEALSQDRPLALQT